mgnify:CR=1 FL=1
MAQVPEVLLPEPGERGLASVDAEALVTAVGRAWDLFGDLVDDVDLDAVARGRGLLAREVVIPLGAWPDNRPIAVLVDEARRGVVGDHDQGTLVDEVRERHKDESDDAIRAAVRRQREELDAFVASPEYAECASLPVASMLGTLPLHLAAAVCARGCRYLALVVDLPAEARGRELSAAELDAYGARLEAFVVRRASRAAWPASLP